MRVTILALGSLGDVQPLAELGRGLAAVGHRVLLVTFENFRHLAVACNLDFSPIRGDVRALLPGEAGQRLADSGHNPLRNMTAIVRAFGPLTEAILDGLAPGPLWDTDAIINQLPGGLFGLDLAEKLGVHHISAAVMPLTRTRSFPMIFFPGRFAELPHYNRLTYRIAEQLAWQPYRRTVNRWRKEILGLPQAPFWGHYGRMKAQRAPVLNGFSDHVVPRPPDWGAHVYVTGYWFPEESDYQPSDGLAAFLDAGPAPVFFGFGSMPVRNPGQALETLIHTLRKTGLRAVLSTGWAGLESSNLPDETFLVDYVPYPWLFPRMAAVVHHGGSGTTAAGLRAGVPSIVVPFVMDQFYWGKRVAELGAGPEPIPFRRLTATRLASALIRATTDPDMRQRAMTLGQALRSEDGIARAVHIISQILSR